MTEEIIIKGTTGVGKSLYAEALAHVAQQAGYRVEVSDHHLFTFSKNFSKELERVRRSHRVNQSDLSIVVINDGEPDLQVTFTKGVTYKLACVLFPGMDGPVAPATGDSQASNH